MTSYASPYVVLCRHTLPYIVQLCPTIKQDAPQKVLSMDLLAMSIYQHIYTDMFYCPTMSYLASLCTTLSYYLVLCPNPKSVTYVTSLAGAPLCPFMPRYLGVVWGVWVCILGGHHPVAPHHLGHPAGAP